MIQISKNIIFWPPKYSEIMGGIHTALRFYKYHFMLKSPKERALFSERYGYTKPVLKLFGWRFFMEKSNGMGR